MDEGGVRVYVVLRGWRWSESVCSVVLCCCVVWMEVIGKKNKNNKNKNSKRYTVKML